MTKTPRPERRQESERRRTWMTPPLSGLPPPVGESSLLAGVLALGDSTDDLRLRVEEATNKRRVTQVLMVIIFVIFSAQFVYAISLYRQIEKVTTDNHALLLTTSGLTDQVAVAANQTAADARAARIEFCTASRLQTMLYPTAVLDSRCPIDWPQE